MSKLVRELATARKASGLTQAGIADRAGLTRMTVQKIEAESIDPRLSSIHLLARALGMELMLVPSALRPGLEDFVRAGGRFLGQAPGVSAPKSVVDDILGSRKPPREKK